MGEFALETEVWESFLLKLRYKNSKLLKTAHYVPVLLNNPDTVYLVYTGHADVYSVPLDNQLPSGTRQFLFTAQNGAFLFGTRWQDQAHGLLVLQSPETQILTFECSALQELASDSSFLNVIVAQINSWIEALNEIVLPKLQPKSFTILDGVEYSADTETVIQVRGDGAWILQKQGTSSWLGYSPITISAGSEPFPVTRQAWLTLQARSKISVVRTEELLQSQQLWPAMDSFLHTVIGQLDEHGSFEANQEQRRFLQRLSNEKRQIDIAVAEIAQTLNPEQQIERPALSEADTLLSAARLVAQALGIEINMPTTYTGTITLRVISEVANIPMRQIALQGEWWRQDQGPLLAALESDHHPVALLPLSTTSYELYDPVTGERTLITDAIAQQLEHFATQFYRRFETTLSPRRNMLRLMLAGRNIDLRNFVIASILLGIANLGIPIVIGVLFDQIIPLGEKSALGWIALWLALLVVITFTLNIVQRLALLRIETYAEQSIGGAFWGRLLSLAPGFFRQYSAGDLGNRILGLSQMMAQLSDATLIIGLQFTYLVFNFLLMLFLSPTLAVLGIALTGVSSAVMLGLAWRSVSYQRDLTDVTGANLGYLWEYINGITKFRIAGAEIRVFATWASQFTRQRRIAFRLRVLQNMQMIFRAVYPLFALVGLFMLAISYRDFISIGAFAAFYVAFTQFLGAGLDLSTALGSVIGTLPLYERAKPILIAQPEVNSALTHPGELSGKIEVSHVSFRYQAGQSLILDDVSFSVTRGEFVAIVGASGSGKSTLLRLLLGFDKPEKGIIYYDNKDIAELDIHAVRQQIGVVMQNAQLMPSDFFKNIVGTRSDLTLDDAWEAARLVGLERDIKAMPMGMQTIVTEGGSTVSGGQRQRLLIAAAIVHRPRIIFFDEATSALDNRTQKIVSESLEHLNATRIVIAHRLSTIIKADKIIMMQAGHIVQVGTYESLMHEAGPFAEMAHRQLGT